MRRVSTKFSRYALTPEELAGVRETLRSSYVQAFLRNMQSDLADATTQWTPDDLSNTTEYVVRMAELRGAIRVIEQIIGETPNGDLV